MYKHVLFLYKREETPLITTLPLDRRTGVKQELNFYVSSPLEPLNKVNFKNLYTCRQRDLFI